MAANFSELTPAERQPFRAVTAVPSSNLLYRGCLEVAELADVALILDPSIHAVLWNRAPIEGVEGLLAHPECDFGEHSRAVFRASDPELRARIGRLLPDAAHAACPDGVAALLDDVDMLCGAFSDLLAADELMVSFDAPKEAQCPRFHVDRVGIRMLVTYRGPGTEILPDEYADRQWLGAKGHGLEDEESGLLRAGARTVHAVRFAVVLLKGEAWPGAEGYGAIHRSPNPRGLPRTLLRVDMLGQLPVDEFLSS